MSKIKWFSVIRVFGLLLVLLYHFFPEILPGGFLGVDVFFTFSGYLITALIIEEFRKSGRFRLLDFCRRRLSRIYPPLVLAIVLTLPFVLLIPDDFSVGIPKQIAAALGFVTNYYEISTGGSYEAQMLPHLYIHTWYLSAEMHFYIIWGILCAIAAFLIKHSTGHSLILVFRRTIFIAACGMAAISYLLMTTSYVDGADMTYRYFSTISHAFPFLIGAGAAAVWDLNPRAVKQSAVLYVCAAAGAAAIIIGMTHFLHFNSQEIYSFGFLAASLLTLVIIFNLRGLHEKTPQSVQEPRPLLIASDLSYDVYLYHWPLYIVFSEIIPNNILTAILTCAVAVLFSSIAVYKLFTKQKLSIALMLAAALTADVTVLRRAPVITDIENSIKIGYLLQDYDMLESMNRWIKAINVNPINPMNENTGEIVRAFDAVKIESIEPIDETLPAAAILTTPLSPAPVPTGTPTPTELPVPTPIATELPVQTELSVATAPPAQTELPVPAETPMIETEPPVIETEPPQEAADPPDIVGGVTIIGDSVCLDAKSVINSLIPDVYMDAAISRTISKGHDVMMDLQRRGSLREYVVIALGTNGDGNYENHMTQIIEDMEPGHHVVFVVPYDGRSNENAKWVRKTAEWELGLPDAYPFVTLANWNALISSQNDLLASDKVHMGGKKSMELYAQCLSDALAAAAQKPEN